MNKIKNNPSILEANILYFLIGIALITLGAYVQSKDIYVGLLITEYIIILLPILLFLSLKGYSIKQVLRLNGITLRQFILVLLIVAFSYPIAVILNFIGLFILDSYAQIMPNALPIPSTLKGYFISILVIALTPGICEEVMFRGILMSAYDRLGQKRAVVYSAILFGFFHFNVQNLLGPIFLGILFGIMVYKTNSLIPTIIGHGANNFFALTIGYVANKLGGEMDASMDGISLGSSSQIMIVMIWLGMIALVFGTIVYGLMKKLSYSAKDEGNPSMETFAEGSFMEDTKEKNNILDSIPVLIILFLFIFLHYKLLFT